MNELQSLFRAALQEEDFASSSFAKMKLNQVLTFDSVVEPNRQQAQELTENQVNLIELLQNEELFGLNDSGNENKGPLAATRLALRYIGSLIKSPKVKDILNEDSQTSRASGVMIQQLVCLVIRWMCSNDVGIGSGAASAITEMLITLTSKTSLAVDNNVPLQRMCRHLETVLANNNNIRHEGEMRLLDSLAQHYLNDLNKEIELGNRVGLPQHVNTGPQQPEFESPLSQLTSSLALNTRIIINALAETEIALRSAISSHSDDNTNEIDPLALISSMNIVGIIGRYSPKSPPSESHSAFQSYVSALYKYITFLPNMDQSASLSASFVLRGAATLVRNHPGNFSDFLAQDSHAALSVTFKFIATEGQQLGSEVIEAFIDFAAAIVTQSGGIMSDLKLENKISAQYLDHLCSLYLAPSPFSELILTKLLLPTKPVSADLKSSALLCIAAIVSSPLFSRVTEREGTNGNGGLKATFTSNVFNNSIFPHKSSLDEATRRACWHALSAILQDPSLKLIAAPSTAAHLTSLASTSYAELNLEVRRSQLLCCDLLLKMPEMAPFHAKLQAERKSGIYSKQQNSSSAPTVGSDFAY